MIEKWRSFIAVTPGQAIHAKAREIIRGLAPECEKAGLKVRWVHPGKIHLTLRFLGDIPAPLALSLEDALAPIGSIERFRLEYAGVGAFPDAHRPRVVWMGVRDPDGQLAIMYEKLCGALEDRGIAREKRPFSPHITIGRVRPEGRGDLAPVLEPLAGEPIGEEPVTRIILYRSTLHPSGAVHEPLFSVSLGRERSESDHHGRSS